MDPATLPPKPHLRILVTGPTGTTGRAVVRELLDRGHTVTGLSRSPEKWGTHPAYHPLRGSQMGPVAELVQAIEGHDVVISAFAPSHNSGPETYCGLVEGAWRLKHAVQTSISKPYVVYVGGAASLVDPETGKTTLDQPHETWRRYLIDGPVEHLGWLHKIIGVRMLTWYYYARLCARSSRLLGWILHPYKSLFETKFLEKVSAPDNLTMPHACRAALYFFEHDHTFEWSFLSPPWFYREGPAAKLYGTVKDKHPIDSKGRYLGINNGDLAAAIADEAEARSKTFVHWSCFARQEETDYYYDNYRDVKFERFEESE